jgi:hypothetical protein
MRASCVSRSSSPLRPHSDLFPSAQSPYTLSARLALQPCLSCVLLRWWSRRSRRTDSTNFRCRPRRANGERRRRRSSNPREVCGGDRAARNRQHGYLSTVGNDESSAAVEGGAGSRCAFVSLFPADLFLQARIDPLSSSSQMSKEPISSPKKTSPTSTTLPPSSSSGFASFPNRSSPGSSTISSSTLPVRSQFSTVPPCLASKLWKSRF